MVYYLVSADEEANAFGMFISMYMPTLAERVRVLPHQQFPLMKRLLPGTYIFSQIETLPRTLAAALGEMCDDMEGRPGFRVLNHPRRSLRRYELLRKLHQEGLNAFQVLRLEDCQMPGRLPVFLRGENDHRGSPTRLLNTPEEFRTAAGIFGSNVSREEKDLVVEFCDTSDQKGTFRKYSSVLVGDHLVPRHLLFGQTWMTKRVGAVISPEQIAEEREFVDRNPHADQVRRIFTLAGIQYGRIDYAVLNGKVQTWEINTNPRLASAGDYSDHPERAYVQDRFGKYVTEAFDAVDMQEPGEPYGVRLALRMRLRWLARRTERRWKKYLGERHALRMQLTSAGLDLDH